jgi:hypothetical protein
VIDTSSQLVAAHIIRGAGNSFRAHHPEDAVRFVNAGMQIVGVDPSELKMELPDRLASLSGVDRVVDLGAATLFGKPDAWALLMTASIAPSRPLNLLRQLACRKSDAQHDVVRNQAIAAEERCRYRVPGRWFRSRHLLSPVCRSRYRKGSHQCQ